MEKDDVLRFATEQHLTPGMFVATLVGLWPIDPPIVDTECSNVACDDGRVWYGSGDNEGAEPCETCNGDGRVPLSVDPGETVTLP